MKIAMVGSGYVGLVSGACFADFGHDVVCIDKDPAKIESLNAGIMPIFEPGLAELVTSNAKSGRLTFTTDLAEGIAGASAIFIAVSTASEPEFTKKTVSRSPGARPAISVAASTDAGWAADQLDQYANCSICLVAAAGMSLRPWPMLTQKRPASPSRNRCPLSS